VNEGKIYITKMKKRRRKNKKGDSIGFYEGRLYSIVGSIELHRES